MKEIPLTKGYVALVDDEDFECLDRLPWYALAQPGCPVYACSSTRPSVRMHRLILEASPEIEVDHQNGNGLDNQRHNLRSATRQQNAFNAKPHGLVSFKGVHIQAGLYRARLAIGGRRLSLGMYSDPAVAARAYDEAARKYFGEFARLNFPEATI